MQRQGAVGAPKAKTSHRQAMRAVPFRGRKFLQAGRLKCGGRLLSDTDRILDRPLGRTQSGFFSIEAFDQAQSRIKTEFIGSFRQAGGIRCPKSSAAFRSVPAIA